MIASLVLGALLASPVPQEPAAPVGEGEREARAHEVRAEAARWMLLRQLDDGSFALPADSLGGAHPLPRTALALWALASVPGDDERLARGRDRAAAVLLAAQQPDGGVYDPGRGLRHATSSVARQALIAWAGAAGGEELEDPDDPVADALAKLDAYVVEHAGLESLESGGEDARARAEALARIASEGELDGGAADAVDFLRRIGGGGATPVVGDGSRLTYEQLLGAVCRPVLPDDPGRARALELLRTSYSLERNPGWIERPGAAPGGPAQGGLYYSYLLSARALASTGEALFVTADGVEHDWAVELTDALLARRRDDGSWKNADPRWWEGDAVVATSYALLVLDLCERRKTP